MAICDFQNGKTDAEQFSARLDLLRRNPRLESRPTNEAAEVMKQFYELSNELSESDDEESDENTQDRTAHICIKLSLKEKRRGFQFSTIVDKMSYF